MGQNNPKHDHDEDEEHDEHEKHEEPRSVVTQQPKDPKHHHDEHKEPRSVVTQQPKDPKHHHDEHDEHEEPRSVVTQQPVNIPPSDEPEVDWSSGLCDCCQDMKSCCCAFWCCPCFVCIVSQQFGQNRCLPLLDILSPAILAAFAIPLFVPPAGMSVRVAARNKYGIKGSICEDIAISCFCGICSWCQMHREFKYRELHPTIAEGADVQCEEALKCCCGALLAVACRFCEEL